VSVQNYTGTGVKTVGYNITYKYSLEGKEYSNTEFVESGPDIKRLFERFTEGDSCYIKIGYIQENPEESTLIGFH